MKKDKVLFVGVGNVGHRFVSEVDQTVHQSVATENSPEVKCISFGSSFPSVEHIEHYDLNEMDEALGHGYTSRRSSQDYRQVAEKLRERIQMILRKHLEEDTNKSKI